VSVIREQQASALMEELLFAGELGRVLQETNHICVGNVMDFLSCAVM